MRGIAALSVAWFHITGTLPADSWVRLSGSLGFLGVEAFFVISGFVIPYSIAVASQRYTVAEFPRFMARRLLRLEPPYLISIMLPLLYWKLSSLRPGFQGDPFTWNPLQILAHFLYLIPLTEYDWIQPVYWTLAWEFAFYISVGLLFPIIGRADSSRYWYALVAVLFVLTGLEVVSAYALLFVIGMAVYRMSLEGAGNSLVAVTFVMAISGLIIASTIRPSVAIVGLATAVIMLKFRSIKAPQVLHSPLLLLGVCSYSLYLTHSPVVHPVKRIGAQLPQSLLSELAVSVIALICALLFAWVYYRLVERPAIALAKRLTTRRDIAAEQIESD